MSRPQEFAIGSRSQVLAPLADLTTTFFQAQRDGAEVISEVQSRRPSHLQDAAATVYEAPVYENAGETLFELICPLAT